MNTQSLHYPTAYLSPLSPQDLDYNILNLAPRLPPNLSSLSCLNLGAGDGSGNFAQQIAAFPFRYLCNVEVFSDALFTLSNLPYQAQSLDFINADALEYVRTLPDKSFDIVLLIDVLEHFTQEQAFELLEHLKRIARVQILLWLPFGDCEQDEYNGNPFQRHQSTWQPEDFLALSPIPHIDICWRHFHIVGAPLAGFVSFNLTDTDL